MIIRSPITPASFRDGDIVEVQFAVALFVTGHEDRVLIPRLLLRAIVSVDTTFSRVSPLTIV